MAAIKWQIGGQNSKTRKLWQRCNKKDLGFKMNSLIILACGRAFDLSGSEEKKMESLTHKQTHITRVAEIS